MNDEPKGMEGFVIKAAVNLSRRGFLKKLGGFGLGAGAALAGIGIASAQQSCDPSKCTGTTYDCVSCRLPNGQWSTRGRSGTKYFTGCNGSQAICNTSYSYSSCGIC